MDTTQTITHVSLCAGYGGIDIGLKRAIPSLRTIAFSEIEAFPVANLVAKMEAGLLDAAPIWTNLKTFPWASFRGQVDILSGGYPCQPFSAAGKRLGTDDPRHLWPYIADGIRAMQPRICFFENVEGHISLGLREVIRELESIGYRATWGIFSAREVGAPHQRKRVFIMAESSSQRGEAGFSGSQQWQEGQPGVADNGGDKAVANTKCSGLATGWEHAGKQEVAKPKYFSTWPSRPGEPQHEWEPPRVVSSRLAESKSVGHIGFPTECGSVAQRSVQKVVKSNQEHTSEPIGFSPVTSPPRVVGNANSDRCFSDEARSAAIKNSDKQEDRLSCTADTVGNAQSERSATCRPEHERLQGQSGTSSAGGPASLGNANRTGQQEWQGQCGSGLQGTDTASGAQPVRQAQPALGGDANGSAGGLDYAELCISGDNRTDELRLLGNGVVPATAELAFRILSERLNKNP